LTPHLAGACNDAANRNTKEKISQAFQDADRDTRRILVSVKILTIRSVIFLRALVLNSEIQRLYELSLDFLLIATHEGQLIRVNPAIAQALGYSEADLENQSLFNFIHPDDLDFTLYEIKKLATGQNTINFEVRYLSSNGTFRRSTWSARADLESGRIYATGRDITDLRASELNNRQTLAALNECAIVARTDLKGKITEVNQRFCDISGYSREELMGKDHRILNSGYHSKDFFKSLWSTIKSGGAWTGDIKNKKKDGSFYWMRTVISPIRDLNETITSYITVRFDVTKERKASEETQFILKALGLGVWRFHTESRHIDYDEAMGELFGMPPQQVDSGL
jgi:PAS domain S-box-containing protein